MYRSTVFALVLGLIPGFCAPALVVAQGGSFGETPHSIIEEARQSLLAALDGNRERFREDPTGLFRVVDSVLRPRFDIEYAGQLILGRYWNPAPPDQRNEFVEALYGSLVRTYSLALLEFQPGSMEVIPSRNQLGGARQVVQTRVKLDNDIKVPVNYTFRITDGLWMAFDVSIEGRSYVTYFRDVIGNDVAAKGLPSVIEKLNNTGWTKAETTAETD
jgi:phospholipid transport system substrate-binding protein